MRCAPGRDPGRASFLHLAGLVAGSSVQESLRYFSSIIFFIDVSSPAVMR